MNIRVRYAPSPTGDLHLGSLRTVIFNYLFAKQNDGVFVMRVEDTDQARSIEGSIERQLQGMKWVGIIPDEGAFLDDLGNLQERGSYGPYTQSNRLEVYKKHIDQLLENGSTYRCFCTPERLTEMRDEQAKNHQAPRYDRRCRALSAAESEDKAMAGEAFVVRQAMPDNRQIIFNDSVRGEVSFNSSDIDDHVLLKSDGFPTYQLANVIDDHLMEISHVLRGEEWIPSTPKNLLLYEAFGWIPPQYAHLPVILGPDGKRKLSKRDGDVNVLDYQLKGYLPETIVNMLAFLGWSPGTEEEFFTIDELTQRFKLEKVQKSAAVFNFERLDYMNGWYIRQMSVENLAEKMLPYLREAGLTTEIDEFTLKVVGAVQERIKHFDETAELTGFFFKRPEVNTDFRELIIPKKSDSETINKILGEVLPLLESQEDWSHDAIEQLLRGFIEDKGYKSMEVLWPIRAALTGVSASPGTFDILSILGKEESLERLKAI